MRSASKVAQAKREVPLSPALACDLTLKPDCLVCGAHETLARGMEGRAKSVFFSLASAVEIIHEMGFESDYFVSTFWSRSHINAWNRELAVRMGLILEEVKPDVAVFDGTWPFPGFIQACDVARVPHRVWSNRGLHRKDFAPIPVKESAFDLVIEPGEMGVDFSIERAA